MISASQRTEQSTVPGDGREVAAAAAGLCRLESNLRFTSPKQSRSKIQSRVTVGGKESERYFSQHSLAEGNITHPSSRPRGLSVEPSLPTTGRP